jgi:hypothetical protein
MEHNLIFFLNSEDSVNKFGGLFMVEFNIYVMFKLCKLFFNLIRSYMIIINHTCIIANRVTLLK